MCGINYRILILFELNKNKIEFRLGEVFNWWWGDKDKVNYKIWLNFYFF